MATILRSPLTVRSSSLHFSPAYSPTTTKSSSTKRARSPEPVHDSHVQSTKRVKATDTATSGIVAIKEEAKRRKEREKQEKEHEFRSKYTRAFPKFKFFFNEDVNEEVRSELKARVTSLEASVEYFFSQGLTHFITDLPEPPSTSNPSNPNKENASRNKSLLQSPIKLKGRALKDAAPESSEELVKKAASLGVKIWSASKLESVLDRCKAPFPSTTPGHASSVAAVAQPVSASKERPLIRLLEAERLGTAERDHPQRRHGYAYFSKNSYFVLVEDLRQELAPIAMLEYLIKKDKEGKDKGSWPVLHLHPLGKGPFMPYDEKKEEERRRQKAAEADKTAQKREQGHERKNAGIRDAQRRKEALMQARRIQTRRQGDLRRSASMNNLQRRATLPLPEPAEAQEEEGVDLDDEDQEESAQASGFRESGQYVAASGNSVGITSAAGTTSTASNRIRALQLPIGLRSRLQQEVVTSRRFPTANAPKDNKENAMGPPPVPDKVKQPLRKSKSTNTLKLPKRDEGTKPGYCESCRQKFDDFKQHIGGKRHRKYAMDDSNFEALDYVLARVRRRTVEEVEEERSSWWPEGPADAEDLEAEPHSDVKSEPQDDFIADDFQWDDWVDADAEGVIDDEAQEEDVELKEEDAEVKEEEEEDRMFG